VEWRNLNNFSSSSLVLRVIRAIRASHGHVERMGKWELGTKFWSKNTGKRTFGRPRRGGEAGCGLDCLRRGTNGGLL